MLEKLKKIDLKHIQIFQRTSRYNKVMASCTCTCTPVEPNFSELLIYVHLLCRSQPPTIQQISYVRYALIYNLLGERKSLVSGSPPVESQSKTDSLEKSGDGLADKVLNGSVLLEDTGDQSGHRVDGEDEGTEVGGSLVGGGTSQHNEGRHGVRLQAGAEQRGAVQRNNTDVLLLSGKLLGGVGGLGSSDGVTNDGGSANEGGEVREDGTDGKSGGLDRGEVVKRHCVGKLWIASQDLGAIHTYIYFEGFHPLAGGSND